MDSRILKGFGIFLILFVLIVGGMVFFDNLNKATMACYEKAQQGDVVLLSPACASWDQYKKFEDRGDEFKQLVKSLKEV